MHAASQSPLSLTSTTDSGSFNQSISPLQSAHLQNRTETGMIGTIWRLSKQWHNGDTISRAPTTGFWSSATIRICSTSKPPKCSPEDRQGGRKSYPFMTLLTNTWKSKWPLPIDKQKGLTMRYATSDRLRGCRQPWQQPPLDCMMTSVRKSNSPGY